MNRLSLKVKLTALYSFFLILVICSVLAILFSLSSREILAGVQATLKKQVRESIDDVSVEDGGIRVDSDFYDLDENVYLALYDENMYFLYGKIPYGFDWHPELTDGRLQLVSQGNTKWYVYDQKIVDNDLGNMFIRGITSVNEAESSFRVTQRFALILLPLLALVTAAVCYRFTRRMLFPVKRITDTVQQIQKGTDLSRRIGLSDTNLVGTRGKERDEIYQMAATFDEMLEQLEESFQREKQFTSDVSHELRTPVSVILAQCETMLQSGDLPEEQKEKIQVVKKKASEMAAMISQLLTLSRTKGQQVNKEYLNLSELTLMCAEATQVAAVEKSIEIYTDVEPDIYGLADETLYIRLLDNLLTNAVYYGKEGGAIHIGLVKEGQEIIGYVEDNGIGIEAGDIPRIWERFYRSDTSRTSGEHVGLGLSMVKWIVEAHGGEISVESEVGKGSIFRFHIPVLTSSL